MENMTLSQIKELPVDKIEKVIKDLMEHTTNTRLCDSETVKAVVCKAYCQSVTDVMGTRRFRCFVEPRQVIQYLLHKAYGYGQVSVGQMFGGMNHATVHHAVKTVNAMYDTDRSFRFKMFSILKELGIECNFIEKIREN